MKILAVNFYVAFVGFTPPIFSIKTIRARLVRVCGHYINDEPRKFLNSLFFVNLFWRWAETFEKREFFTFGQKQCFYLTYSAPECIEKL